MKLEEFLGRINLKSKDDVEKRSLILEERTGYINKWIKTSLDGYGWDIREERYYLQKADFLRLANNLMRNKKVQLNFYTVFVNYKSSRDAQHASFSYASKSAQIGRLTGVIAIDKDNIIDLKKLNFQKTQEGHEVYTGVGIEDNLSPENKKEIDDYITEQLNRLQKI